MKNGIIHHEVIGRHGATAVFMQPAKKVGVKAGGPMRLVFDAMVFITFQLKVHGST